MLTRPKLIVALGLLLVAGCSQDRGDQGKRDACKANLDAGYRELNKAEADGFSGTVDWGKAASLLAAAKVQEQFEEWENCMLKAQKARSYLRR